jgi:signal transduction histidine kinase
MVALWALLIEVALASVLSGDRFTLSWYAGRFYQLVTATVVMVVLLVETTKLYSEVARANELLQQERLLLQLAVQAQRRERAAKLMTGDAVAAAIAHEVKQPLSAMITHADAGLRFLDRPDPDQNEAKEAFTQIVADGHRAEVVIRSMRSLFATGELKKELFDLNDLIEETLALMRADLEKHQIQVAVGLDRGLPKISGDRVQLQQVLVNLATNASDAMAKVDGARDLFVRLVSPDDDYVRLSIADTGVGVDAQDAERIFNPLFSTKPDGMGMGLAICRSIIQAHEGQLWMSPNTPRGAVFHISLPRSA